MTRRARRSRGDVSIRSCTRASRFPARCTSVGALTTSSLEEIWNGEKYVDLRRRLLDNGLFPVCRRCCKVELSNGPVPEAVRVEALPRRRAIPVTVVR
ncbi:MAG: hypothetical protein DMF86_13635 [Acidobacteria bacterium]|nr:MAG: hypothetical protein DMF86_13635 [Acidobacteriota bacterium]